MIAAAEGTRVGILGGTFDPIDHGHLQAAEAARRGLTLDKVLLLPARTPPHRSSEPHASSFHRFAMAALAATTKEGLEVSDLELHREGPSYTSVTLERLHADGYRPSQLFFILGADAFAEIETWHDYPRLFDLSNFVIVSRPGCAALRGTSGAGIFFAEASTPDVSSTEIRRRIGANAAIDGLTPPIVVDHIRRHRLYAPAPVTAVL